MCERERWLLSNRRRRAAQDDEGVVGVCMHACMCEKKRERERSSRQSDESDDDDGDDGLGIKPTEVITGPPDLAGGVQGCLMMMGELAGWLAGWRGGDAMA